MIALWDFIAPLTWFKAIARILLVCLAGAATGLGQSSINENLATNVFYASPTGNDSNDGRGTNSSGTVRAPKTLNGAIHAAMAANNDKGNSKVWLMDGDYRVASPQYYYTAGTNILIVQALHTNQAAISGSALVTNWSFVGNGLYTLPWTNKWGMGDPSAQGIPGTFSAYGKRQEMLFIDGYSLLQQCDTHGNPVATSTLAAGQFTVDETNQVITFKPQLGITLSAVNKVEVSVNQGPLFYMLNRDNLVLRGLVFHHCAGFLGGGNTVFIGGMVTGGNPNWEGDPNC